MKTVIVFIITALIGGLLVILPVAVIVILLKQGATLIRPLL